jgi:hypothetical protein
MTQQEFDDGIDGTHVPLTCEDHPNLRWSCKKIALSLDKGGRWRYNGSRNLFFKHETGVECACPTSKLHAVIEE